MDNPLEDIRVIDLGQIYVGGYVGTILSHLGAEVIKVEPPAGDLVRLRTDDSESPHFQLMNSGKRGMALDLKSVDGKDILKDLVREADVLIENFTPGTMNRLGVGYETLKEVNPKLIYGHASGYGDSGPYKNYPAMDLTIQAMGGIMHTTGYPDQPPVKAGPAVGDFLAGTHLATAIMTALYMREVTGDGQYVDVAMLDSVYPTMTSPIASWALERDVPPRTGNQHSSYDVAPFNSYEVEDGYVILTCVAERHWENLCTAMDRPELAADDRYNSKVKRAQHREEIDELIQDWLGERDRDSTVELLLEHNVPAGRVQSTEEVVSDPHLEARNMLHYVPNNSKYGKSELPVTGLPMKFSGTDEPEITPAPTFGEHTHEILSEVVGYSGEQIQEYEDEEIIR